MTEAYAIKDSNGEIIAIGMTQAQAWNAAANRIAASAETVHSCVPVVVSEKGEAEALLKKLVDRLHAVHADPLYHSVWALHQIRNGAYTGPQYAKELAECDAYLSRGQG